ncbi:MAG TPA: FAD binding domain-containing protein [Burkholderiaceae bacterium]|jgi:carbon-monoxide dehydrogenase medium subunit
MKAAPFEYRQPQSAAQAVAMLGASEMAKACGGSQSLGPMLNLRLAQVDCLVDLSRIEALTGFSEGTQALRIGAGVTHARIEDGELPDVTRGLLPRVAAGIAYRAVRNRGTVGGSLAHADPAADWVNTMCLLDAAVVVLGATGERRVLASEFFLGPFTTVLAPDDVIVAVEVPRFSSRARWAYRKTCRKPGEFADAIAAAWVDPERGIARALIGALGGMPHLVDGEAALAGLRRAGGPARALDDAGVTGDYEREVHAVMLRRALDDLDRFPP